MDNWTGLGGHFGKAEERLREIGIEQGYSEQEINDAMVLLRHSAGYGSIRGV